MSYIGKQYVPIDNSYSITISDENKERPYLAGTAWDKPTVTTIFSEPFEMMYYSSVQPRVHKFVILQTEDNRTHLYLFHEHGVVTEGNTIEMLFDRASKSFSDLY